MGAFLTELMWTLWGWLKAILTSVWRDLLENGVKKVSFGENYIICLKGNAVEHSQGTNQAPTK